MRFDRITKPAPIDRKKFDRQFGEGLKAEDEICEIFQHKKVEVKSETYQWQQYFNLCIEYRDNKGEPSGLDATEADYWMHRLSFNGELHGWLIIPMDRLRRLCAKAYHQGRYSEDGGDGKAFCNIKLPIEWVLYDGTERSR